jgi:acyl-CoA synthetase (AMP-forming)/AMP-acid ligase II
MNVAACLPERAAARPEQAAVVVPQGAGWSRTSFGELDRRSDAVARGLLEYGIQAGERTLVMVRPGLELILLTYALLKAGAVPVLIDPGMGLRAFLRCVADTRPGAFIGIPLAQAARLLFPRPFRDVRRVVTVGARLLWGGTTLRDLETSGAGSAVLAELADDATAAILFTSGSTGPAKGAVYSHGNFRAQIDALGRLYAFQQGEIDLAAFPLFSLFDGAFGMTSVVPELDASRPGRCDPARIVAALTQNHCTTAFGSPAIWRRVAPYCRQRAIKLPELRRVLIAGASVAPALVEDLRALLPEGADVHTPYGATEALPVASISGREVTAETARLSRSGRGTCVGRPAPGIELRIVAISDDPIPRWSSALELPSGEVGEICVKGPVVTRAYFGRDDATGAAKIEDGDGVWHRMGDLGYLDEAGRLWFAGRKAERVRTAAGPAFTDFVEGRVAAHPRVARCALVGVGAAGVERPVLVVEGREDASLARELQALAPVQAVLFHPRFPLDVRHNAKIHRLTLKRWAESRLASQT